MSDHLTPPPRRPLPLDVRDRIRGRVTAGLVPASVARMNRLRAPLAAAASVAVLAAGAAIVAQSVGNTGGGVGTPTTAPTTTSGATLDRAKANAELDRCWLAVQREGKAGQFPDRSQWRPVMNYNFGPVNVTAARAAGKPLFCETTYTTVTVSDPNVTPSYAPGTKTGSVLYSRAGTLAGVVDPSWPWMWVAGDERAGEHQLPATVKDGLFLVSLAKPGLEDPISVIDNDPAKTSTDWTQLPAAPPAAVSIVDRPVAPAPDRVSARGRLLDQCIKAADQSPGSNVIDAESWAPGAVHQDGDNHVIMARNPYGFSVCWQYDRAVNFWSYQLEPGVPDELTPTSVGLPLLEGEGPGMAPRVLAGVVPAACVRMQVLPPNGGTVEADVANATFAVAMPADAVGPGNPKTPNVRLFDANGAVIYEGPLD